MALKASIRERCDRCGGRAARKVGDYIAYGHRCPEAAPGPADPPGRVRADQVIWQPAEFDAAFLRAELDEAWLLIDELRDKRWRAEEAAREAVREAMREVYTPRGSAKAQTPASST